MFPFLQRTEAAVRNAPLEAEPQFNALIVTSIFITSVLHNTTRVRSECTEINDVTSPISLWQAPDTSQ